MMRGDDQDEIVGLQAEKASTKQGSVLEVERMPGLFTQQFLQPFLAVDVGNLCKGNHRQRELLLICDDLDKCTVHLGKRGTQDLVSINQTLEASLEGILRQ